ncbi:hypothetical protein BGX38DRAFT_1144372 [Terfezia claveryi]|nr:hypothetical protein BGX38DRAFT_1144372 [Terfezia claveryi]
MKWTPDKDLLLLIQFIEAQPTPTVTNAEKIRSAWPRPPDSEVPTSRAIKDRIRFLRNSIAVKSEPGVRGIDGGSLGKKVKKGKGGSKPGKEKWQVNLDEDDGGERGSLTGVEIKEEVEIKAEESNKNEKEDRELYVEIITPIATPQNTTRKRKSSPMVVVGLQGWQTTTASAGAVAERIKKRRGGDGSVNGTNDSDDDE